MDRASNRRTREILMQGKTITKTRTDQIRPSTNILSASVSKRSIHGPAMVPSLPWIARLMRWAGFEQIHYVPLPSGVPDAWGFRRWYRVMFVGVKG